MFLAFVSSILDDSNKKLDLKGFFPVCEVESENGKEGQVPKRRQKKRGGKVVFRTASKKSRKGEYMPKRGKSYWIKRQVGTRQKRQLRKELSLKEKRIDESASITVSHRETQLALPLQGIRLLEWPRVDRKVERETEHLLLTGSNTSVY